MEWKYKKNRQLEKWSLAKSKVSKKLIFIFLSKKAVFFNLFHLIVRSSHRRSLSLFKEPKSYQNLFVSSCFLAKWFSVQNDDLISKITFERFLKSKVKLLKKFSKQEDPFRWVAIGNSRKSEVKKEKAKRICFYATLISSSSSCFC